MPDLLPPINNHWTLFLDRDGVINQPPQHIYARNWEEFVFAEGALEALEIVTGIFNRIIVVSNQQGVMKGEMNNEDLTTIHTNMKHAIEEAGGRIDGIYTCTALAEDNHPDRKPNTGMAQKAVIDFPDINFSRSLMVGDKPTDIEFGKNLSMYTVLIKSEHDNRAKADLRFSSLFQFARYIERIKSR